MLLVSRNTREITRKICRNLRKTQKGRKVERKTLKDRGMPETLINKQHLISILEESHLVAALSSLSFLSAR